MNLQQALETHGTRLSASEAKEKLNSIANNSLAHLDLYNEGSVVAYYELSSWWKQCQEFVGGTVPPGPILEPLTERKLETLLNMEERHLLARLEIFQVPLDLLQQELASAKTEVEQDTGNVERATAIVRQMHTL